MYGQRCHGANTGPGRRSLNPGFHFNGRLMRASRDRSRFWGRPTRRDSARAEGRSWLASIRSRMCWSHAGFVATAVGDLGCALPSTSRIWGSRLRQRFSSVTCDFMVGDSSREGACASPRTGASASPRSPTGGRRRERHSRRYGASGGRRWCCSTCPFCSSSDRHSSGARLSGSKAGVAAPNQVASA